MKDAIRWIVAGAVVIQAGSLGAQEKVTYADQVLPLVEQHCAKCHNPDKKKGDLDLTSHAAVLRGGGTGPVVVPGQPEASKLIKVLTHAEEPTMPPNKPPLPEKEVAVFRKWIAGGLLETAGSKAIATVKPSVDLAVKPSDLGRPAGPPPMPGDLPLETVVHTRRAGAILGLAASPWAPLVAIAGQKQILLFHTTTRELLGILPFEDGQPWDLKFSRSGRMLLAGGGHGAQSGRVHIWTIETGERVATVGREYDTVLAADLSPDQTLVALGGPDRLVKIFATQSGELEHKLKKHTDWVTAVAFSPDGEMLASADRNGGLTVWDTHTGQELFTPAGHKAAITALHWRPDSKLIASSSEDGTIKLWETSEGKQAKSWNAHAGGALCVAYARDGRLLSCGRDGAVTAWSAEGGKLRTFDFTGEMALRCAWTDDDTRVVAGDFAGQVWLWDAASGQRVGVLDANPGPLAERLAALQARVAEIQARGTTPAPAVVEAQRELAAAQAAVDQARRDAEKAQAEFNAHAAEVVRLKEAATRPDRPADLETRLAAARAAREKARAWRNDVTNSVQQLSLKLSAAKSRLDEVAKSQDPAAELAAARAALERLQRAQARATKTVTNLQSKR
ncbi:MAG TPA: c-type cytochrome domain-containing protein [Methylomirabilota bacterium]|nr:c-type cytochrome domain-containing protein [Methylomirabilota bacterium]